MSNTETAIQYLMETENLNYDEADRIIRESRQAMFGQSGEQQRIVLECNTGLGAEWINAVMNDQ